MKKALAICGAAILAAASLAACNAENGKVNNNRNNAMLSSEETYSRRNVATDTASGWTDHSVVSRDNIDSAHTDRGVIENIGSTVGEGVNDVAQGIDNVGSSVASNVEDFFDGNTDTGKY